jgi:hypothetical protein
VKLEVRKKANLFNAGFSTVFWISYRSDPGSRFLKLRYFGFRGNAQFVCLAQPEALGPRFNKKLRGPTARPFALCWHPKHHKLPDPSALTLPFS